MAQSVMESLFGDDPFFQLWPRRAPLTSFREDFLQRRAQLMESFRTEVRDTLLREVCDGLHADLFQSLDNLRSSMRSRLTGAEADRPRDTALILTLDTQGFSPDDISVTVCGRRLEVMAGKTTPADSKEVGFIRSVELPGHVDPADLSCTLDKDGLLHIECENQKPNEEERLVPLRFRTSLDFPITKDNTDKMDSKTN